MRGVIPKEIYENKPLEIARRRKINVVPIKVSHRDYLYSVGNDVYFDNYRVHPEAFAILQIPFAFSVSIHFSGKRAKLSQSEIPRRKVVNKLIGYINDHILANRIGLEPVCREAKAVWAIEFGKDSTANERHCHILFHLHPKTPADLAPEICRHLSALRKTKRKRLGIQDLDAQVIAGNQNKCVSYFCKIERGRGFKAFEFSKGFKAIALKCFIVSDEEERKAA